MAKKPTNPKLRRPGRPAAGAHSTSQRERLLDAALELFSQQGIAATSSTAIARRAHVTPALLHYYFENRARLLDAVIAECLLPVIEKIVAPFNSETGDTRTIIARLAERLLTTAASTPWLPPLWVREVLNEEGQLRTFLFARIAPAVIEPLRQLVQQAQARGELNAELEPGLVVVSVMGLTIFPFAAESIWRQLPGNENITTETLVRHMLSLLTRGLEP